MKIICTTDGEGFDEKSHKVSEFWHVPIGVGRLPALYPDRAECIELINSIR